MTRHRRGPVAAALTLALLVLTGCSSDTEAPAAGPSSDPTSSTAEPPEGPSAERAEPEPISIAALAEADLPGGGLRMGTVRERTASYTSYDVTFRSTLAGRGTRPLTISGVLNVPRGQGPFPAVVLAHGFIEPSSYVRGQGMTRERGFLADRGYVALHVDYRNHAESTDDPRVQSAVRLGYSTDVIAATKALRASDDIDVDPERIALFGRSMGTGVILKALEIEPGLAAAGVAWASVSSLEAQNYRHFNADDPAFAAEREAMRRRHGLPDENPAFWRGISSRPAFGAITEPVLLAHGRNDETCPPRWARATQRALTEAGVDSTLGWYDDQHAFGPAFVPAMNRTVDFLDRRMPG